MQILVSKEWCSVTLILNVHESIKIIPHLSTYLFIFSQAIEQLRTYQVRVLLTSDLTARGIDVEGVNLVCTTLLIRCLSKVFERTALPLNCRW